MSMRVNHNITSMNSLRHLGNTSRATKKNLERLSSGMKINSAADGPASLMISERMRAQISGIRQAINNGETSISMVQTAEGSLNEVSNILITMRQLAIHAANEGVNDNKMLEADQSEIENLLQSLDRIAKFTQFGTRTLLDGSNGANGVAVGDGVQFVSATPLTEPSPESGYEVDITQVATRATAKGTRQITWQDAISPIEFTINEGGRVMALNTGRAELGASIQQIIADHEANPQTYTEEMANQSIQDLIARNMQKKVDEAGLQVDVFIDEAGMLTVRHRQFGSKPSFTVTANKDQILSERAGQANYAQAGKDIAGFIGGEVALGKGQELTGSEGTRVEGLTVRFTKELESKLVDIVDPDTGTVVGQKVERQRNEDLVGSTSDGFVHVAQNSLAYQIGPNAGQQVKLSIDSVAANKLARGIKNESSFTSLADIDVTNAQGAQDAIRLIDEAINEVSETRADLGAFQQNALETTLNSLRVSDENLTNAESIIRDSDMAEEMSQFTRNQIMMASGTAMAAQANQLPKSVLQLLSGAQG